MSDIRHVLSRGVDKRKIFMDDKDYFRFIHDLFEFNTRGSATACSYHFRQSFDVRRQKSELKTQEPREPLVSIHAFCLMPNHYHLLLSPTIESGIPLFMKKLNGGYVKYFNTRHERTGTLFESKYKSILVENERHFLHLPYYIHLNPLDLMFPEWRERKLRSYTRALDFLSGYRWSSHLDYLGEHNFPSVIQKNFLLKVFGGEKGYGKSIKSWLRELDLDEISGETLE